MIKEDSTANQPSKSTLTSRAELLKKRGINSGNKSKESLGKISLIFSPLQNKELEEKKEESKLAINYLGAEHIMSKDFVKVKNNNEHGDVIGAGKLNPTAIKNAKVGNINPLEMS